MKGYEEEGCFPAPPPPQMHVEVPTIETKCHKGYKAAYIQGHEWVEALWHSAGEPEVERSVASSVKIVDSGEEFNAPIDDAK
jgi:hypothetical protein